jgi:hypothetical protein
MGSVACLYPALSAGYHAVQHISQPCNGVHRQSGLTPFDITTSANSSCLRDHEDALILGDDDLIQAHCNLGTEVGLRQLSLL